MKKYVLIFLLSFVVYWMTAVIRGGYITIGGVTGFPLSMLTGSALYFIFTIFLLYKFEGRAKRSGILLSILLGCLIMEIPIRIIGFKSSLVSLPDILFKAGAILSGYSVYVIRSRPYKAAVSLLSLALLIWMTFRGYELWLQKLNFGTFTGRTEQVVDHGILFQDADGGDVALGSFNGKYLLLDFWSSTCGVCIKKFPEVQKIYETYKNRPDVEVFSLFCRRRKGETARTGCDILLERGYSFPVMSIDGDTAQEKLGITGFPTILIFDPHGTLVFRGNLSQAERHLTKLIDN